jgi:hypothetical protein
MVGEELGAFGGGMNAVVLNGAGDGVDVGVEHGKQGDVILGSDEAEGFIEGLNVIGAIVGGEGDAGENNFAAGVEEGGDDGVEIAAGIGDGDAAQAVVAAEFDNDDGGMEAEDVLYAVDAVFACVAADAGVNDPVAVATVVKGGLEVVGPGVAGIDAEARGDAVSEAVDYGNGTRGNGAWRDRVCIRKEQKGGDEGEGHGCVWAGNTTLLREDRAHQDGAPSGSG